LNAAVVYAKAKEVVDAAEFVLARDSGASGVAREIARKLITPEEFADHYEANLNGIPENLFPTFSSRQLVRHVRRGLRRYPWNAIAWMDLSRAYLIIGEHEKARRAVHTALSLGSENRFVLRSAARFFIHQQEPWHAHRLLRSAAAVDRDPWLTAAAIASALAADGSPTSVRAARQMLSSGNFSQSHTSELASALASLELKNGRHNAARKLFKRALIHPTENAIAQAEYASFEIEGLEVDVDKFDVPRMFEARAWENFVRGKWDTAFQNAQNWLIDQPFSSRPAMLSSYIASTVFDQHELAENVLNYAVKASPGDAALLNNLAYSLAMQDRPVEAERILGKASRSDPSEKVKLSIAATWGLIRFRQGLTGEGRRLYLEAIEAAERGGHKAEHALASIHLAFQEVRSASTQSIEAIKRAIHTTENVNDNHVRFLLNKLQDQFDAKSKHEK
jgi:tetratricopeptide (TPR) repeat protein